MRTDGWSRQRLKVLNVKIITNAPKMILNFSFKLSIDTNIIYKVITFAFKAIINHKRWFLVWCVSNVSFYLLNLLFFKFHIQLIKSKYKLSPFTLSDAYQTFLFIYSYIFFNYIIFLLTHLDHVKISFLFDMHIDCSQTLKKYFFSCIFVIKLNNIDVSTRCHWKLRL